MMYSLCVLCDQTVAHVLRAWGVRIPDQWFLLVRVGSKITLGSMRCLQKLQGKTPKNWVRSPSQRLGSGSDHVESKLLTHCTVVARQIQWRLLLDIWLKIKPLHC